MRGGRARGILSALALLLQAHAVGAATITVPDDHATIQAALDAAVAGDDVLVKDTPGPYVEQISFPASGTPGAYITLQAFPGHQPVIDGTGLPYAPLVTIDSKSWVRLVGFELRNNLKAKDAAGVLVIGAGSHIEVRDNRFHDLRGKNAMAITVYGTQAASISELVIDGNEIHDCEPAPSEALALNGNVEGFAVTDNVLRDVNNIGIVLIGGERDIQPDPTKVARNGVVRGNRVTRARSIYGGGYAGGIYVDGGRDILVERNVVSESDLGIEIGAENSGIVASGVIVRDNVVFRNDKACIAFGGYAASAGRVENCSFLNNTCVDNDRVRSGFGELWIQLADDSTVRNNVFRAGAQNLLLTAETPGAGLDLDHNLWFAPGGAGGAGFAWAGTSYAGLAAFQAGSGQDASSLFGDPQLVAPAAGDFRLSPGSPAVDGGDPAFVPPLDETDFEGAVRVAGVRVDAGADELTCGNSVIDFGETCDDGNLTDCDGCDSNCVASSTCGNRIVCGAETCDDGNTRAGDCCSATCVAEAASSTCDDGDLCTRQDQCDGGGACVGSATPDPLCRDLTPDGSALIRLDDRERNRSDKLYWRFLGGAATVLADFGDPTVDTQSAVCLYDQSASPQPLLHFDLPAGGVCRGRAVWRTRNDEYGFTDRCTPRDGLFNGKLKVQTDGTSYLLVKGKGEKLKLPPLGVTGALTVQLRNDLGGCWGTTFSSPTVNTALSYRATND